MMEKVTTEKILETEVRRLKEEVLEGRKKVAELRKELSEKEEKLGRQDEQLSKAAEDMVEQHKRMEALEWEQGRKQEELEREKTEVEAKLKQGGVEVSGAFGVFSRELKEHLKQCCGKRGKGEEIGRRLGEVEQLIGEKFGGMGGAQGEVVQLTGKRKASRAKLNTAKHSRDRNRVGGYYCVCEAKFSRLTRLNTHIKVNVGVKRWKCGVCALKFYFLHSLRKHERKAHGVVGRRWEQRKRYVVVQGGMRKCSECSAKFRVMATLLKHQRLEHQMTKNGVAENGGRGEQVEGEDRGILTENEDGAGFTEYEDTGVLTVDEDRGRTTEEEGTGTEDDDLQEKDTYPVVTKKPRGIPRGPNKKGSNHSGGNVGKQVDLQRNGVVRDATGRKGRDNTQNSGTNGDRAPPPQHFASVSLPRMCNVAKLFSQKEKVAGNKTSARSTSSLKGKARVKGPIPSTSGSNVGVLLAKKQRQTAKSTEHGVDPSNPRQCLCGYSNKLSFSVKRHVDKMTKLKVGMEGESTQVNEKKGKVKARKVSSSGALLKAYKCGKCGDVLISRANLIEHRKWAHGLAFTGGRRRKDVQECAPRKRNSAPSKKSAAMGKPIVREQSAGTESEPIPIPITIYIE